MGVKSDQQRDVVVTRLFDAPREIVFRAGTDPEQLKCWYTPDGCTIEIARMDVRAGGEYLTCIRTPDFHDCWCKGVYREIVPPQRLVYSMVVADEHGNAVAPASVGMNRDWPAETILTVTFTEKNGKTTVTLHQTVDESLAKRTGAHPSWILMLDRLDANLKETASPRRG